eukprot:6203418-Pyramimonas_sp.AAC.1
MRRSETEAFKKRGLAADQEEDVCSGQAAPNWRLANEYEGGGSGLEAVDSGLRSRGVRRHEDEHDSYVTRTKALSGGAMPEEAEDQVGGDAGDGRGRGRGRGRAEGRGTARGGRGVPAETP